jgi:hypothetical protein
MLPYIKYGAAPSRIIYRYLSTGTAGEGVEMNVDGDPTPVNFYFIADQKCTIVRFNLNVVDAAMTWGAFGAINLASGNGCLFQVEDESGGVLLDFTAGQPIKSNADWSFLAGVDAVISPAAGDDAIPVRFTIEKSGNQLNLQAGQRVRFSVRDDLSGLTKFRIMAQGYYRE